VILAANLTDSAFFPLVSALDRWLMVRTLRAEALEAGEPEAARRAISGGLLRVTVIACLLSVLLALVLFPVLPRIRSGVLFSAGLDGPLGVAGFSDQVELGEIGRIRMDPEVALRIETLEGELPVTGERYWRTRRSSTAGPSTRRPRRVPGDTEIGVDLTDAGTRLVRRIARADRSGVIFSAGVPTGSSHSAGWNATWARSRLLDSGTAGGLTIAPTSDRDDDALQA
jgi:hypothetical protein